MVKWLMAIGLAAAGVVVLVHPTVAMATEPGGANQLQGVEGKINQTLFNGTIRLTVMTVRNAENSDKLADPQDGNRWVVLEARGSNGKPHDKYFGQLHVSLVNAAGDSVPGEAYNDKPDNQGPFEPGASWHQRFAVEVPANFVLAKILVTDGDNEGSKLSGLM